jgi:hypothetical protein
LGDDPHVDAGFRVRAGATYPTIVKRQRELRLCPNLADYDRTCHHFTWHAARLMLKGLPRGRGLNIAHEAVDRMARLPQFSRHHPPESLETAAERARRRFPSASQSWLLPFPQIMP